jgi:hypothetical protein
LSKGIRVTWLFPFFLAGQIFRPGAENCYTLIHSDGAMVLCPTISSIFYGNGDSQGTIDKQRFAARRRSHNFKTNLRDATLAVLRQQTVKNILQRF